MSFDNVGRVWTRESLRAYLKTIKNSHGFKGVCIHHTAEPSLAMRLGGLTVQHIENMQWGYQNNLGWSRGPHLFTDENQCFGMTPLTMRGNHAVSFNNTHIGVEMLGNFDREDPKSGRGLEVCTFTAGIVYELLDWLGVEANAQTVRFHRDDPQTRKSCPGRLVQKDWFLDLVDRVHGADEPKDAPIWRVVEEGFTTLSGREVAGRVCVPISAFLIPRGITSEVIATKLHRKGDTYYFGDDDLEGAYFDKEVGATMVPVRELNPLVGRHVVGYDAKAKVVTIWKEGK
jgi:hypothetical protein